MRIIILIFTGIALVIVTVLFGITTCGTTFEPCDVIIHSPDTASVIESPLVVQGEAPGPWFFEANIIVELQDSDGNQLAIVGATATDEWMTEDMVPFEGTLEFETDAESGFLIIRNDNASGLPEHEKSESFPVKFK